MKKEYFITINLKPTTKKNSQRIVTVRGRPIIIQAKNYLDYEKDCLPFLKSYKNLNIDYPINLKCVYYMPTKRKVDLGNLQAATCDILVKYKVINDDNHTIVQSMDGSRVLYDKNNPRTEITITNMERISNEKTT